MELDIKYKSIKSFLSHSNILQSLNFSTPNPYSYIKAISLIACLFPRAAAFYVALVLYEYLAQLRHLYYTS